MEVKRIGYRIADIQVFETSTAKDWVNNRKDRAGSWSSLEEIIKGKKERLGILTLMWSTCMCVTFLDPTLSDITTFCRCQLCSVWRITNPLPMKSLDRFFSVVFLSLCGPRLTIWALDKGHVAFNSSGPLTSGVPVARV